MWSLFQFLDDDCRLSILDIGASLSEPPEYQHLINLGRARLMAFEPDPNEREKLKLAYGDPHQFFPHFVGDGDTATYYETNWAQTGSLFKPNTSLLRSFRNLASVITPIAEHQVQTRRLDDIPEIDDVDFLKIDVQGSELKVFQNAKKVLDQTLIIQTEVNFVQQYEQQPMFSDVDEYLRKNGFQYHTIRGHGYRPFKPLFNPRHPHKAFNQQLWSDAIYVKDWMHLDQLSAEKLARYAALLHDIFGSFDLAYKVLHELDRRRGTSIAKAYQARLERDAVAVIDWGDDFGLKASASEDSNQPEGVSRAEAVNMASDWFLDIHGDLRASVPASLRSITTYVLLEQERWFEKEMDFVRRCLQPGNVAIDIGANVGMYSLQMAGSVGATGSVFSYEPGCENRRHLEASCTANGLSWVHICPDALSSEEKKGFLRIASTGELNMLVQSSRQGDAVEEVRVTTLDREEKRQSWGIVHFVKLDAEGQEARIIAGGKEFFLAQSPLVMFEIKHGSVNNETLRWQFGLLDYSTYRLTGDARLLVPVESDEIIDSSELNLFVAKADRANSLAQRGLLARRLADDTLRTFERDAALGFMCQAPFARSLEIDIESINACPYGDALADYAAYCYLENMAPDRRYSALLRAFDFLSEYCEAHESPPAWSTFARCSRDLGRNASAISVLKLIAEKTGDQVIDQPFFPAVRRFDALECSPDPARYFFAAALESLHLLGSYSTYYSEEFGWLKWLAESPHASPEILRRAILVGYAQGLPGSNLEAYRVKLEKIQKRNLSFWCRDLDTLKAVLRH